MAAFPKDCDFRSFPRHSNVVVVLVVVVAGLGRVAAWLLRPTST